MHSIAFGDGVRFRFHLALPFRFLRSFHRLANRCLRAGLVVALALGPASRTTCALRCVQLYACSPLFSLLASVISELRLLVVRIADRSYPSLFYQVDFQPVDKLCAPVVLLHRC